jgi:aldose sugar dehydrogenase
MFGTNPQENEFPDGRGGILRIDERGRAVQGIVGNVPPLDLYYAYGIRNSFGMDFDPLTGELWDTENGPGYGDEVNLVRPGFNSGWTSVQGVWEGKDPDSDDIVLDPDSDDLIDFDGRLEYSAPELAVYPSIGFTALAFLDSTNYGQEYENDILVGDFHNGHLYDLDLNAERTGLVFNGQLGDNVANDMGELDELVLGQGFGGIIDIEIGPDGYIYVLSLYQGGWNCERDRPENTMCIEYNSSMAGTIFRIVPTNNPLSAPDERGSQTIPST